MALNIRKVEPSNPEEFQVGQLICSVNDECYIKPEDRDFTTSVPPYIPMEVVEQRKVAEVGRRGEVLVKYDNELYLIEYGTMFLLDYHEALEKLEVCRQERAVIQGRLWD